VRHTPADCICRQQMAKELSDIAQLVGFQPMDEAVLATETILEHRLVITLDVTEALR
jgi:hypothetical protein